MDLGNQVMPSRTMLATDPKRLAALQRSGLLDHPVDQAFDRYTRLVCRLLNVPVALISLIEADRQFFLSEQGLDEPWSVRRETPLSHSFCQHVVGKGQPLMISDARVHPLVWANKAIEELNVVAYLGVPLIDHDGYVLGSLCAIDHHPRVWQPAALADLQDLATTLLSEFALRRALVEQQRQVQHEQVLKRELAHRVKNGLQLIINALQMQAMLSQHPPAARGLQAAAEKIATLTASQDLLFGDSEHGSVVGMPNYLRDVTAALEDFNHHIDLAIDDVHLPTNEAILVGLLVNEALTNVLKYAFPDQRRGAIVLRCMRERGAVVIEIRDNGVGAPALVGQDPRTLERPPIALSLADMLGGTLCYQDAAPGLRMSVRFASPPHVAV